MKKVKLLLGNFTFHHFSDEELKLFSTGADYVEGNTQLCLIHELDDIIECNSIEEAGELGEEKLNDGCESYLIPDSFGGEIVYEPNPTKNINELIIK